MRRQHLIPNSNPTCCQMAYMFYSFGGTTDFNQPLAFDTVKVTDVRVYCVESNLMTRRKNLIPIPTCLIIRCAQCSAVQRPSTNHLILELPRLWMWEYMCRVQLDETPESDSLYSFPTFCQMYSMFSGAAAFNQPLSLNTAKVTDVRVYLCWVQQEKPECDSPLKPNMLQMGYMFDGAAAFNQPIYFDTAKVTDVRA